MCNHMDGGVFLMDGDFYVFSHFSVGPWAHGIIVIAFAN